MASAIAGAAAAALGVGATLIVTVVPEGLVAARGLLELAAVGGLESVHVICEILQELVRAGFGGWLTPYTIGINATHEVAR